MHVYVYHELAPTPMLSFAVRQLGCGCGIVVSASHNAGIYNGIKCYGPDGCQMTDEPAARVFAEIEKIPYFLPAEKSFEDFLAEGGVEFIAPELWERYYETVLGERLATVPSDNLNLLYTPLCGTGNKPVRTVLGRIGVNVAVVPAQEKPDGDFKTCEYPNPETDAAVFPILRYCLTAALPLWLGCQALSCLCFFLFKSDIAATFACVGVVIVVPTALDLFSLLFEGPVGTVLRQIYNLWPTTLLEQAPQVVGDSSLLLTALAVGAVWLVGFTALGLWRFSRREIH